jgi:transcriptional regulator with XRE-family HTH domain
VFWKVNPFFWGEEMNLGENIRAIRNRKGITIAELCEGTGLSKGFVSQIENGKTSPSIATLQSIAEFLRVPLPYLLLESEKKMKVVRKVERHMQYFGENHMEIEMLTPLQLEGLRMMIAHLPPGAATGDAAHSHEGEECHLVLEGKILAQQGEDEAILEAGDSFSWKACVPHRVVNIGDTPAKVLIAVYSSTAVKAI